MQPFFEQLGQGPNLVLLHGWGIHGGIFESLYPELSEHFRITNIDLPGFGRSPLPNGEYSLERVIEQVLSVAPDNAHYLGWSLGGLIASAISLHAPHRVDKLVTVASNLRFTQADDWPFAMKPEVMNNFMTMLDEDYESTLIRFLAIQTMGSPTQKEDIQRLKESVFIHGQPSLKALRGGLNILNQTDLRDKAADISHPWLRVYGRLDGLVPVKAAQQIGQLSPSSEESVFRKASHAPFLSHPTDFCHELKVFLQHGEADE